jgi:hypothetical protein
MTPERWFVLEAKIRKWAFAPWWRYYPVCALGGVLLLADQARYAFICFGIFFISFSALLGFTGVALIFRRDKKRGSALIAAGLVAVVFSIMIALGK